MDANPSDSLKIDEEETISDSFICCVCLDLLHKPIVLECGHVSCFWCVHRSMDGLRESCCPICRNRYHYFPTICEMLHFLLIKMYPLAYKRREKQILEEEKQTGYFSPQLDGKELDRGDRSKTSYDTKADSSSAVVKENCLSTVDYDRTSNVVSRTDVLCPGCKQLLYRPTVLNCGHVYCQSCIVVPEDGVIICSICESPHPNEAPNVCLEFNNFLEERFPEEYALRRENIEHKQLQFRPKKSSDCSSSENSTKKGIFKSFLAGEEFVPWWKEHGSKLHVRIGCDYCGMYPIVGDRYKCQDCTERIGFDLCGDCYNTSSKRPGRFNQQHTPDHRFLLVKQPNFFCNIMLRFMGEQRTESSGGPILAITAGDDSDDMSVVIESHDSPQLILDHIEDDIMHVDNTDDGAIAVELSYGSGNNNAASDAHQDDKMEQDGNC